MNTTYNQIIKSFEDFCNKHEQINTFYSGQEWNFQTETNIYPTVILLPQPSTIRNGEIEISFNLFVSDLLNQDNSNLDEVYSDTLLILTDIISYFRDPDEIDFSIREDEDIQVEFFEEKLDDILAGVVATFNISIPFLGGNCGLPISI